MMKSLNDSTTDDGNNHNFLGFSLSTNMKMEVTSSDPSHHHHYYHQAQLSIPTNLYLSPSHLSTSGSGIGYSSVGENAAFHSPLAVMPLKSDGSLCIMEAISRSQTQVMVPKLEDFLGGATVANHEYGSHEREAMALSLDSIYYNTQNAEPQINRDHSLELLSSEHFGEQGHNISVQSHALFPGLTSYGNIYQTSLEQETRESQMPQMAEEAIAQYSARQTLQQQMNDTISNAHGASGPLQSLSLSMSPGSQSSSVAVPCQISPSGANSVAKKRGPDKLGQKHIVHRKSIDTFGQRTSQYRGVTRHRWTGRYEAHLWDNSCKKEGQTRKGRQVYLGGYDMEEKAARAYDLAALKYWGPSTHINFPLENYRAELEAMKNMSRQEYVAHLRRKSSGFSRGASMYRGVTRHHQHGRWQARIGRVAGNKDLYLGTFSTQEEAAEAYDIAAIKFRGLNAVTNFDISRYDVERIMSGNTLLAGGLATRNKDSERVNAVEVGNNNENGSDWKKMILCQSPQQQQSNSCDQKTVNCGNYRNSALSGALQDLIGIHDSVGSVTIMEDSSKIGTHFSNPSSLVTSLNSSREGTPDKRGPTLLFPKSPMVSERVNPIIADGVSSWFPTGAATISMSHLPIFATWNDT